MHEWNWLWNIENVCAMRRCRANVGAITFPIIRFLLDWSNWRHFFRDRQFLKRIFLVKIWSSIVWNLSWNTARSEIVDLYIRWWIPRWFYPQIIDNLIRCRTVPRVNENGILEFCDATLPIFAIKYFQLLFST